MTFVFTSIVHGITNKRRVDDEPWDLQVIHLLKLVSIHNQSTQVQTFKNMDDIVPTWITKS